MPRRSQRKLLAIRHERAETAAASRRRDLARRYPDVKPAAWANMGAGQGGAGAKALRAWLASLQDLLAAAQDKP